MKRLSCELVLTLVTSKRQICTHGREFVPHSIQTCKHIDGTQACVDRVKNTTSFFLRKNDTNIEPFRFDGIHCLNRQHVDILNTIRVSFINEDIYKALKK